MKSLLTLTFVLLFGVVSTTDLSAQSQRAPIEKDVFRQLISIQMVESLSSPLAMVRNQTLKNAIVFSTLYPERADLGGVVARVAELATDDSVESNRRLAVAALRSMNSFRANQYLARLEGMQDAEYRTLVAGVLTEYRDARSAATM